jgi:hypothetical protein
VKKAFDNTVKLAENEMYEAWKDHLACAIVPVHTIGNVRFKGFRKDTNPLQALFFRDKDKTFSPKFADQPFRLAMSFILSHYLEHRSLPHRLFDLLGGEKELRRIRDVIQRGINRKESEIVYGEDLIFGNREDRLSYAGSPPIFRGTLKKV